jgi:LacI family transcriptional regulator
MIKISDVAREAGVSAATVSRVLNNHPNVNAGYAKRVRDATEFLGYRPNGIARSLRRQSTDLIALIISDIGNPFFTAVARGVEDVAQRAGYSVLLCNADESPDKEETYLRVAEEQQVAGVLLSPHAETSDVSRLSAAGIPLVVIDRPLRVAADSVMVNSFDGAKLATEHLIDEGWKRPACITGPQDAETARQRLAGYCQAIDEYDYLEPVFRHAPFRQGGGRVAAASLLDSALPPDAIFVANSQMALGVLDELGRRGVLIGRDMGVITFDDAPWAPFVSPPMSVVTQPAYDIGAQAAQLLMARLQGGPPLIQRQIVLSTSLVVRESSRRIT